MFRPTNWYIKLNMVTIEWKSRPERNHEIEKDVSSDLSKTICLSTLKPLSSD